MWKTQNTYQHFEKLAASISVWKKICRICAGSRFLQKADMCLQKQAAKCSTSLSLVALATSSAHLLSRIYTKCFKFISNIKMVYENYGDG
jgi:hypothetical protein